MCSRTAAVLMTVLAGIAPVPSTVALGKAATAVPDAAASGVGVVASYIVTDESPSISRVIGHERQPLKVGAIVIAGDEITLPAGASVTVFLTNGTKLQWLGPGTFVVPQSRSLGPLAAIFASLPRLFDDRYQLSGTAATRSIAECTAEAESGSAIELLGLDGAILVEAGVRDLQIHWLGGCPPFSAEVIDDQGTVAHHDSLRGREVRFERVALSPGRYGVKVMDASGMSAEGTFEAVREVPSVPAAVAADSTELGVITGAIWLAQIDGGRWRMESLERLHPLARAGNPLAVEISRQLLQPRPLP